jgi:hypothetical protein
MDRQVTLLILVGNYFCIFWATNHNELFHAEVDKLLSGILQKNNGIHPIIGNRI